MKKKLFTFAVLILSICVFSTKTFSQSVPGGENSGDGSGDVSGATGGSIGFTCPLSYSFKRNNGNGNGVCGGDAQVRVTFNPMPAAADVPMITAIYYEGKALTNIILPVSGDIVKKGQGYISYCLLGSAPAKNNGNPIANIPPAVKLVLEFTYPNGTVCRSDNEVPGQ